MSLHFTAEKYEPKTPKPTAVIENNFIYPKVKPTSPGYGKWILYAPFIISKEGEGRPETSVYKVIVHKGKRLDPVDVQRDLHNIGLK